MCGVAVTCGRGSSEEVSNMADTGRRAAKLQIPSCMPGGFFVVRQHCRRHTYIKGKKKQTKTWLGPPVRGPGKHRKQPADFSFSTFTCTQQASRHSQPAELAFFQFPSVRPLTAVYGQTVHLYQAPLPSFQHFACTQQDRRRSQPANFFISTVPACVHCKNNSSRHCHHCTAARTGWRGHFLSCCGAVVAVQCLGELFLQCTHALT